MSVVVRGRVLRRGAFTVAPASPSPLSFPATEQDAPGTGRMPRARRVPKAHVDGVLDGNLDPFIEAYLLAAAGGTLKKGGVAEEADAP